MNTHETNGGIKPSIDEMNEQKQQDIASFLGDSLQIALLRGGITKNYRDLRLAFCEGRWRETSADYHLRLLAITLTQFDGYRGSAIERVRMALHILETHFEHPTWRLDSFNPKDGHQIDQLLPAL
jgi:hypothetical protein